MELNTDHPTEKMIRAKKRLEELKGFYWHFAVYLVVNIAISVLKISRNLSDGETFNEAFWDFGTFAVWFFWGIGLAFHAARVFSFNPFFGKDWEEKQIQKFMEEEKQEKEKFK
ncbi:MAG: 2TM domain-containing protein [Maribacter sp.]|nr:2TM domain-containing protein [Maribacter sp.]